MLDPLCSRQRQKRLLEVMQNRRLDAVVVSLSRHVYYFSAHWPFVFHQAAFILFSDGRSILVSANAPQPSAAADQAVCFPANFRGTLRQDQCRALSEEVLRRLADRPVAALGYDSSPIAAALAQAFSGRSIPIDDDLHQMRRAKDADELALIRVAVDCCQAMYDCARRTLRPGIDEMELYGQLHAAAVRRAGEPLSPPYLGNDYACGDPGGPARGGRRAEEGELFILDLGPAYRGYFSDNARTFAVGGRPTEAQHRAWRDLVDCFDLIERAARPGVRCVELFAAVEEHLKSRGRPGMVHHLGHGVGLEAHEFPHLNPDWDDWLIEGEIFTAEPGIYHPELRGGIRLEQIYRVTATGVETLIQTPLDL